MSVRSGRQTLAPEALAHLRASDPVLAAILAAVGPYEPSAEPDVWWSLLDAIAGQQLSVKAAATILGRVAALDPAGRPGPDLLLATPDEALRACGLSAAKTRSVKDLAAKRLDGTLRLDDLPGMDDDAVVAHLTRVRGIGRWTAEMILIFTLQRPDVLPVDDLGLQNAVRRAYGLAERPSRAALARLAEPWRPYRSAASLYLWRSLSLPAPDPLPPDASAGKQKI